jgi:5'-3' exonuclease
MNTETPPIMLVDARNVMYRAIFANKNRRDHHFVVMLRFLMDAVHKFKPKTVHIFWDAPKSQLWRRKVFPGYKLRDDKPGFKDIKDDLIYTQSAAKALFANMGVIQFDKAAMEADDLIYAACKVLYPEPIIVLSSDQDYVQLPYRMHNVKVYDAMKKEHLEPDGFDPVIFKCFAGDKSDCIDGYEKIGPVNARRLALSREDREEFLNERGRGEFIKNMLIVDLALCPDLLKNILYVNKMLASTPVYDKSEIMNSQKVHKVKGLVQEYSRLVTPFKLLLEKQT